MVMHKPTPGLSSPDRTQQPGNVPGIHSGSDVREGVSQAPNHPLDTSLGHPPDISTVTTQLVTPSTPITEPVPLQTENINNPQNQDATALEQLDLRVGIPIPTDQLSLHPSSGDLSDSAEEETQDLPHQHDRRDTEVTVAINETGGSGGGSGGGNISTPSFDPGGNDPPRVVPHLDHEPRIEQQPHAAQPVSAGPQAVQLPRPNLSVDLTQNVDSERPEESGITEGVERAPDTGPYRHCYPIYTGQSPPIPPSDVHIEEIVPEAPQNEAPEAPQEEGPDPALQNDAPEAPQNDAFEAPQDDAFEAPQDDVLQGEAEVPPEGETIEITGRGSPIGEPSTGLEAVEDSELHPTEGDPILPVPPGAPIAPNAPTPHIPVPGPRNTYPDSIEDPVDNVVKKPSLSINFGRIINYGGSALKINLGACFRMGVSGSPPIQMLINFNIGIDAGISPHEPNLLQGHGTFGSVEAQIKNHEIGYELGRIAPFSKASSSGVKYNKISYNLPLEYLSGWFSKNTKLQGGYYTVSSWLSLPFNKDNLYCGIISTAQKEHFLPGKFLGCALKGTGAFLVTPFNKSDNHFQKVVMSEGSSEKIDTKGIKKEIKALGASLELNQKTLLEKINAVTGSQEGLQNLINELGGSQEALREQLNEQNQKQDSVNISLFEKVDESNTTNQNAILGFTNQNSLHHEALLESNKGIQEDVSKGIEQQEDCCLELNSGINSVKDSISNIPFQGLFGIGAASLINFLFKKVTESFARSVPITITFAFTYLLSNYYIKICYVYRLEDKEKEYAKNKVGLYACYFLSFSLSFTMPVAFLICWSYSQFGPKKVIFFKDFSYLNESHFTFQKIPFIGHWAWIKQICDFALTKKISFAISFALAKATQFFVLPLQVSLALTGLIFARKRIVLIISSPEVVLTFFFSTFLYSYSRLFIDFYLTDQATQHKNKGKKGAKLLPQTCPPVPKFGEVFVLSVRICTGWRAVEVALNLAKYFFKEKQGTIKKEIEDKKEQGTTDQE